MNAERTQSLLTEWRARARAALAEVNHGVQQTLDRLVVDEQPERLFGAPTQAEVAEAQREKRDVAALEAAALNAPAPQRRSLALRIYTWRMRFR